MKGRKALIITGSVFLAIALVVVLVLGYFGFLPWMSRLMGTGAARDLGVELTVEHAYAGAELMRIPTTPGDIKKVLKSPEDYRRLDATLSSHQASSLLLIGQSGIPNWPLSVVQIRFNGDGTAEASGYIDAGKAVPFMLSAGVSESDANKVMSALKFGGKAAFYVKGSCGVTNNAVDLSLSEVQIGRLTVPASWYQGNEGRGTPYITNLLNNNGFMVKSMSTGDGKVTMKGTQPLSAMEPYLNLVQTAEEKGE